MKSAQLATMPIRLKFVSDSKDVEQIREDFPQAKDFNSFFVEIENGDYKEVWGMTGIVLLLDKRVYRIK